MFRVYLGPGKTAASDLETRVDEWVSQNAEWAGDPDSHSLTEYTPPEESAGTIYYRADVRFEMTDAKANLLQKFEDKLKQKCAWYRVGYHECTHDETYSTCEWAAVETVEWTAKDESIPPSIPNFND